MATDLSQQLRDYRLTKRRENLGTAGRIAGGVLDIPLQGMVSGSVQRWGRPADKPLTLREKINTELKSAEKSQAQSARQKATVEHHMKKSIASAAQRDELKAQRTQIKLTESEAKIEEKWRNTLAPIRKAKPPNNRIPSQLLDQILKDVAGLDAMKTIQMLDGMDPGLRADLNGTGDNSLATDSTIKRFQDKYAQANEERDKLEVKIQMAEEQVKYNDEAMAKAEAGEIVPVGEGISGVQTGVPTGSQYSAVGPQSIARIQDLINQVPDIRKDSQKQHAALAADEKMRSIARGMGLNPDNSIQMDHFIKTMTKAEKKARKLYAKARRKGWTEQEMAAELKRSNLYSDPKGLSNKHMLVEMQLSLLGVKEPKALATTLTPEEIEDVEEKLTSEYEEEFDEDKADLDEVMDLQADLDAFVAAGNDLEGATMEDVQAWKSVQDAPVPARLQAIRDADLDEVMDLQADLDAFVAAGNDLEGATMEDVQAWKSVQDAKALEENPMLAPDDDPYEWQGVPEEDLAPRVPYEPDFNPDDFSLNTDPSLQDSEPVVEDDPTFGKVVRRTTPDLTPELAAAIKAFESATTPEAKAKAQQEVLRLSGEGELAEKPQDSQPQPLSFTAPRVDALQESLTREQAKAKALANALEGPGQEDKAPPKTQEQLEQERKAKNTTVAGAAATL